MIAAFYLTFLLIMIPVFPHLFTEALSYFSAAIAGGVMSKAVVTENVPPFAIIAGNPGKIIAYRYKDMEIIDLIQKIEWWNWPDNKIIDNSNMFNLRENDLKKELLKLVN